MDRLDGRLSLTDPEDRLRELAAMWPRRGRVVLCAEGAYEPDAAIRHYLDASPPTSDSPIHLVFGIRRTPFDPTLAVPGLTVGSFIPGRGLRGHEVIYHRASYHEICRALQSGTIRFDTVIACASRPDPEEAWTLAGVDGYLQLAIDGADEVIVEEVPWLPCVPGAARVSQPTVVVPTGHEPGVDQPGFSTSEPTDGDRVIAAHIVGAIPVGATVSMGIGRIPDAVAEMLIDRAPITVRTGAVQPAIRRLRDAGALGDTPIAAIAGIGDDDFLAWAATVPGLHLESSLEIHDPARLAAQPRMVTVLGAIQINPEGAINSEVIDGRVVSGIGGAPDFARGAHSSTGGLTIAALPSHGRSGNSRLVGDLPAVSVGHESIDLVVTELGVADLRGKDAAQRSSLLHTVFGQSRIAEVGL